MPFYPRARINSIRGPRALAGLGVVTPTILSNGVPMTNGTATLVSQSFNGATPNDIMARYSDGSTLHVVSGKIMGSTPATTPVAAPPPVVHPVAVTPTTTAVISPPVTPVVTPKPPTPVTTPAAGSQPTAVVAPAITPTHVLGPPVTAPPAVTPAGSAISTTTGATTPPAPAPAAVAPSGQPISTATGAPPQTSAISIIPSSVTSFFSTLPPWAWGVIGIGALFLLGGEEGGSRRRR